jgi:hypothetical protein
MWPYWEHLGEHIENLLRTSMWTIENLWEHKLKHQNPKKSWTSHPPLPSPQKEKNYSLGCILSCPIGYMKILFLKLFVIFDLS